MVKKIFRKKLNALGKAVSERRFLEMVRDVIRFKFYLPFWKLLNLLLDQYYGVDTEKVVSLGALGFSEGTGERYESTPLQEFLRIMKFLHIQSDDVFLDMGSGKGRVMLLAGRYPFKRILGVDMSVKLNEIAEKNIKRLLPRQRCKNYFVSTANASTFEIPEDVTHIYFFNPFPAAIMSDVLKNLKSSIHKAPRLVIIIYYNPKHASELEQVFPLVKLREFRFHHFGLYDSSCNIYQMNPA